MQTVTLDDKYTARSGRVYLSGVQALVRLALVQRWRDEAAGLHTAGFVSGYRGSPLGGLDEAFWKAERHLQAHHVRFQPGINEDLAATAVWGSQQVRLVGGSRYDGVFGIWYGKGPGVDRTADVFKHGNHAGTSPHGGVLLVAGDDHGAYSSTLPHQSDHLFAACMVPVLYPCNVHEYIELGLHGLAMSRFSGCFVGFKALADTVESSASIDADPFATRIVLPQDFRMPEGGVHARLSTDTLGVQARKQEALMQEYKIYAALAYARANRLNRVVIDAPRARLGIVASGKSFPDVMEALRRLGLGEAECAGLGIRVMKVSMPWPLEPESLRAFAEGLEEVLVVEEKRQIVEYQIKEQLYHWPDSLRPRVVGKFDRWGEWEVPRASWVLPSMADFSVAQIARVLAARLQHHELPSWLRERFKAQSEAEAAARALVERAGRTPPRPAYYCSGCPHNSSTRVPDGSLALAGIGCHVMATAIYPEHNKLTTHMGGEGAPWIGQAPFSDRRHVFANLGDGTYFHSGYLAVRAAIAAKVNITYKILYNDAVAMTGGQPVDGTLNVPMIAHQMAAEGVRRIALVTEDLTRYADRAALPPIVTLHDRTQLDRVQRELRELSGTTVLIYDQTCAAEKRRRRKKGEFPDPPRHLFINEAVCEGCGDCGIQSNCTSLVPVATPLGRKRAVEQSSCNKDFSCVKGFCPSFVTVHGARLRRPAAARVQDMGWAASLPLPAPAGIEGSFNIYIAGIGGTGVITIGALLGMAAHLQGLGSSVLDMTGMSQKNGAVVSHVRLTSAPGTLLAQRIPAGECDLLLGCDMLAAASPDAIGRLRAGRTLAVMNLHEQPSGRFAQDRDWALPVEQTRQLLDEATARNSRWIDATRLATALLGDAIATNLFMLGYAFQLGSVPLALPALLKAIELNGVAVEANRAAFAWGRRAALDPAAVEAAAFPGTPVAFQRTPKLPELVAQRVAWLTAYQDAAYARRFEDFVDKVRRVDERFGPRLRLTRAVAANLAKLMAYKDEYEVARLFTDPAFEARLREQFEGDFRLGFNLAPPGLSRRDAQGHPVKREFGSWMRPVFRLLSRARRLRGTALDPFGRTAERRAERALIDEYRSHIDRWLPVVTTANYELVLEVASVPDDIRGFGHVKQAAILAARARWARLEERLRGDEGDAINEGPGTASSDTAMAA